MSGRSRHQYGRSATTSYTNILQDSGGDILNRCSNLFNKFASRVRAASQSGDDRVPLHDSSNSTSSSNCNSVRVSHSQYPMLLKYNKYDEDPRYADYKSTAVLNDTKGKSKYSNADTSSGSRAGATSPYGFASSYGSSSGYGSGSSYGSASSRYGSGSGFGSSASSSSSSSSVGGRSGHALAPSASFSSFSTFKSDYGNDYGKSEGSPRSRYSGASGGRPTYSRTASDLGFDTDYGLRSAYSVRSAPAPNYDKIGARYKPSRFLKKNHLATGCDEEDESTDELSVLRKNVSSKKHDYWSQYGSQYGSVSPNVMERCLENSTNRLGNLSPQLRRRHGDGGLVSGTARQRALRPVTVPDTNNEERESTASIMNRYSGLSTCTLDTETGSTTSSATPDSIVDDASRRKERAQLLNMYSLPLNVLHNIGSTHNRKFLKRVKEPVGQSDQDESADKQRTRRYDQVKEMAAKVASFSSYGGEEEGSQGPPRKVLYGSASTSDVLSAIGKSSMLSLDTISKHSTPESEKFILHEPPIVFEKAAVRDKPLRPSFGKPVKPTSLALSRTNTVELLDSPTSGDSKLKVVVTEPSKSAYSSLMDSSHSNPYGAKTPTTPTTPIIKISGYMDPVQEYTFSTFKPSTSSIPTPVLANALNDLTPTTPSSSTKILLDPSIAYVPALTPKSPQDPPIHNSFSDSVKPKTASSSSNITDSNFISRPKKDDVDTSNFFRIKVRANGQTAGNSGTCGVKSSGTSATSSSTNPATAAAAASRKAGVLQVLGIQEVGVKSNVKPAYSSFYSSSSVSSDVSRAVYGTLCSAFAATTTTTTTTTFSY